MNNWIIILLLAISTYASRIIGLEIMKNREIDANTKLYFEYVPIGIIAALLVKQILLPGDGGIFISYSVLVGCIITMITMKKTNKFLSSVIAGGIVGFIVRLLV